MSRRLIPFGISTLLGVGLALVASTTDWNGWLILLIGVVLAVALVAIAAPLVLGGVSRLRPFEPDEQIITTPMVTGVAASRNCADDQPQVTLP